MYGPYLHDPRLKRQTGTVYKNTQEAIDAAIRGERPVEVNITILADDYRERRAKEEMS